VASASSFAAWRLNGLTVATSTVLLMRSKGQHTPTAADFCGKTSRQIQINVVFVQRQVGQTGLLHKYFKPFRRDDALSASTWMNGSLTPAGDGTNQAWSSKGRNLRRNDFRIHENLVHMARPSSISAWGALR